MSFMDYVKGPEYKARASHLEDELLKLRVRHSELENFAAACGLPEVKAVQNCIKVETQALEDLRAKTQEAKCEFQVAQEQLLSLRQQIVVVDEEVLLESFALYTPKFQFTNSTEYKERLEKIRVQQRALIKAGAAAGGSLSWVVNGKKSEGTKLANDMMKLLIRSFNNECDYCVDNVKFKVHRGFPG